MEINKHINNKTVEVTGGVQNSSPPPHGHGHGQTRTKSGRQGSTSRNCNQRSENTNSSSETIERTRHTFSPCACLCVRDTIFISYILSGFSPLCRAPSLTRVHPVCVCRASALCVRASIFRETKTGENINSKETASGNEGAEAPHMRACVCVERAEEGQCVGVAFIAVCIISYSPPTIPHALSHPLAEAGEVTLTPATLTGLLLAEVSLDRRIRFRLHARVALLPVRGAHLAVLLHELKSLQQA